MCIRDRYYFDVTSGITSWELPFRPRPSAPPNESIAQAFSSCTDKWLETGAPVQIVGLRQQPRFNNQVGSVIQTTCEHVVVRLPEESSGSILAVKLENLLPLPGGTIVELAGLTTASCNGMVGTVVEACAGSNRSRLHYKVKLSDGSEKSFKATNLKPKSRLWDLGAAISNGKKAYLHWRDEDCLLFIDSNSQHRRYNLHLPLGFDPIPFKSNNHEQGMRYPLIVYMHGAGGEKLFTKKSLKTPGIKFAAQHFVVLAPQCDWNWRESPKEWLLELIEAFRALEWIDYRRIYLTGLSMGGMATWEVAARRPHIFAAIAPVAAHHKQEMTHEIARKLTNTPFFAVHDRTDQTCKLSDQEMLWAALYTAGNTESMAWVTNGIDHCTIGKHAYCDSDELFQWLWRH